MDCGSATFSPSPKVARTASEWVELRAVHSSVHRTDEA